MSSAYPSRLSLYIAGEWRDGGGREEEPVINPATGETLAMLPHASEADLDEALEASARGFDRWRTTAPEKRAAIMMEAARLLRERADHIATLATLEEGKILAEAKMETDYAASLLEFHAGEALRITGRVLPRPAGSRSLVLHQPIGPVVALCPWNFPITNVVRKISPALSAGCSVILKPSEETPASAIEIVRCLADAGLPGDVVQCVFGRPDAVSRHLIASPITRKLSFTGSVPVGKHLQRLAADTMMRTTMELGGHAPVLVFDDCDLDRTLDMLVSHKFRNAGQVCISPTRFHVQRDIYERFATGFAERTRAITVGSGMAAETGMGPLANPRRPDAIEAMVADALTHGAKLMTGGERQGNAGFFFAPTVLRDVPLSAGAMNDEPFGPLALMRPFDTFDEAIEQANRLPFGLAAYCFTENGRRQTMLGDTIEAGMVAINTVRLAWADAPFGGMKDSGTGSEDGPEGVAAHLTTKSVHIG